MISLAALAIFSGLSLNLLLQFALGTSSVAADSFHKKKTGGEIPLAQFGFLFISALFLWVFFNKIVPAYWKGFSEFFLFFPLSALACIGLELLTERVLPLIFKGKKKIIKIFSSFTAYDGLVPASLIITSFVAENFAAAFVLSLFFALGNLTAMLILNEIRRKSTLEWMPRHLRGSPLILISMGLLSLISVSVAGIFFKILEVF